MEITGWLFGDSAEIFRCWGPGGCYLTLLARAALWSMGWDIRKLEPAYWAPLLQRDQVLSAKRECVEHTQDLVFAGKQKLKGCLIMFVFTFGDKQLWESQSSFITKIGIFALDLMCFFFSCRMISFN